MRFSLDDVVRYTVVDTALQSGTVQFVPGCVATRADRFPVEGFSFPVKGFGSGEFLWWLPVHHEWSLVIFVP